MSFILLFTACSSESALTARHAQSGADEPAITCEMVLMASSATRPLASVPSEFGVPMIEECIRREHNRVPIAAVKLEGRWPRRIEGLGSCFDERHLVLADDDDNADDHAVMLAFEPQSREEVQFSAMIVELRERGPSPVTRRLGATALCGFVKGRLVMEGGKWRAIVN